MEDSVIRSILYLRSSIFDRLSSILYPRSSHELRTLFPPDSLLRHRQRRTTAVGAELCGDHWLWRARSDACRISLSRRRGAAAFDRPRFHRGVEPASPDNV